MHTKTKIKSYCSNLIILTCLSFIPQLFGIFCDINGSSFLRQRGSRFIRVNTQSRQQLSSSDVRQCCLNLSPQLLFATIPSNQQQTTVLGHFLHSAGSAGGLPKHLSSVL